MILSNHKRLRGWLIAITILYVLFNVPFWLEDEPYTDEDMIILYERDKSELEHFMQTLPRGPKGQTDLYYTDSYLEILPDETRETIRQQMKKMGLYKIAHFKDQYNQENKNLVEASCWYFSYFSQRYSGSFHGRSLVYCPAFVRDTDPLVDNTDAAVANYQAKEDAWTGEDFDGDFYYFRSLGNDWYIEYYLAD